MYEPTQIHIGYRLSLSLSLSVFHFGPIRRVGCFPYSRGLLVIMICYHPNQVSIRLNMPRNLPTTC